MSDILNDPDRVWISILDSPQLIEPQGSSPRHSVPEEGGGDQGGGGGGGVPAGQVKLTTIESVHSITENIMRVRDRLDNDWVLTWIWRGPQCLGPWLRLGCQERPALFAWSLGCLQAKYMLSWPRNNYLTRLLIPIFTSVIIPSSCPSLTPFSLVEDQQSLWPILLTCVCFSLLILSIMYTSTWYTRMETCSLEEIERLNLWSELQLFLVAGVMIQTRVGWGQAPRGRSQPRCELALADHDDDSVFKCCLHLLTQNIDNNC